MEIIFLRTQKLTVRLALALLVGLFGVAVLMNHSFSLGEAAHQSCRRGGLAGRSRHLVDRYDLYPPPSSSGVEADERGCPDAHRRSAYYSC